MLVNLLVNLTLLFNFNHFLQ